MINCLFARPMLRVRRVPLFAAGLALLALPLLPAFCGSLPERSEARLLMGTLVEVRAAAPDAGRLKTAIDAAYAEMSRLSDMMNHYDPDSVVSQINREAGRRAVAVPPELMEVLLMAGKVSARTGGAFDVTIGALRGWRFDPNRPRIPSPEEIRADLALVDYRRLILDKKAGEARLAVPAMRIDLGGIAKLYILNAGMQVLADGGVARAMINGGGDVVVRAGPNGRPWRLGVRHPDGGLLGVVEMHSGFLVSSGDYERFFVKDGRRYHHILDPRTGYPANGPRQVTLLAETLEQVNGLSAALMVLGTERSRALVADSADLEALIVDSAGRPWFSPGFKARFSPSP